MFRPRFESRAKPLPVFLPLIEGLRRENAQPHMNGRIFLTVAWKQPALPRDGNCFVVTCVKSGWYLGTWAGNVYRIPSSEPPIELCLEFLKAGDCPIAEVPESICQKYGLVLLTESEIMPHRYELQDLEKTCPPAVSRDEFVQDILQRQFTINQLTDSSLQVSSRDDNGLWFVLHENMWYVCTPAGRVYGFDNEDLSGLCFEAMRAKRSIRKGFPRSFRIAYCMWEVADDDRNAILAATDIPAR